MSPQPFCTPECRANGGWVLNDEGKPTRKCECRWDPTMRAIAARESALAGTAEAHPSSMDAAMKLIEDAARAFQEFSANDVRGLMDAAQIPGPVIGAAFNKARFAGLIAPMGRTSSSKRNTHGHGISRYRSLIYGKRVSA